MARVVAVAVLALALVASCVAVVYAQHLRRAWFVELEGLERDGDELRVHWGRLRLESSTWAAHERVERIAREGLGLRPPAPDSVVLVTR